MNFVEEMKKKAREYKNFLVLPEGTEPRTVVAAAKIVEEKLAGKLTLLGKKADVEKVAKDKGVSLEGITIVDPSSSEWIDDFAQEYFDLRKKKVDEKGNPLMPLEKARIEIQDPMRFGAMMVRKGFADTMVSGALSSTADMLRAGLTIIKTAPGTKTASSCFVIDTHDKKWGHEGLMIFGDCAVNPDPDAEQLADIAISSAKSCKDLLGVEPAVAMLSFSTKGSAKSPSVEKVQNALKTVKEKAPSLLVDGELQADAALIPSVTAQKAPGSPIEGKVNTMIFPDLNAGNIGYKLVQRLAHADAYGPVLQGFAKPISDLSRGCSSEDIVVTCAITMVQAGKKN
ncbi:phosphate acetyltransferase [Treponema parvum]|uniref:Phosphate acetyltransferase n=1 Tax=Treponema parvum TaxID=138851 RepID=A0A975F0J4_9SPIR|nr:phosphate acetyltransferase [Treponema parvum]QTQ12123.1 phosphate acetyltransferase [Treponema parvum]